jgi:hypothetical protein
MVAVRAERDDDADVMAMADEHAAEAEKPAKATKTPTLRIEVTTIATVNGTLYGPGDKVEVADTAEVREMLAVDFARILGPNEKLD